VQGKKRKLGKGHRPHSELSLDLSDAVSPSPEESHLQEGSASQLEPVSTGESFIAEESPSDGESPAQVEVLPSPTFVLESDSHPPQRTEVKQGILAHVEDAVPQPPAVFEYERRGPHRRGKQHRSAKRTRAADVSRPAPRRAVASAPSESQSLELLEAAAQHSDDPVQLSELGQAYLTLGRYGEAEECLRRAQRLDPERVEIRTRLGILAFRRGLCAQAEADLLWACEHDPQDSMAHLYRGEALNLLGRIDEAMDVVEIALRLNPESSRSHYLMGILLDRKNRNQEASTMYRRARELASR